MLIKKPLTKNFLIVLGIIGAVALNNFILGGLLQNLFFRALSRPGPWFIKQAQLLDVAKSVFIDARGLAEENRQLEEENSLLKSELVGSEVIRKENQFLRRQLKVSSRINRKLLLARIFSVNRTPASSTLLIDKGEKDGMKNGLAIVTAGNILVGVVRQVLNNSSVIWLLDDPRLTIDVRIQGTDVLGRSRGLANGSFDIELLSYTEEVEIGTPVLTAGLGGVSEALLAGEISYIGEDSGNLFQKVTAKSFFEINAGAGVFVILE